jgi:hypothetical protein
MGRLLTGAALVGFLSFFCLTFATAVDPVAKMRICVKGQHDTGMRKGKYAVTCAKCELKRGAEGLERGCRDFYDPKQALKYWDKHCCD